MDSAVVREADARGANFEGAQLQGVDFRWR